MLTSLLGITTSFTIVLPSISFFTDSISFAITFISSSVASSINSTLPVISDIVVNENVLTADGALNGDGSIFRVWTPIGNSTKQYSGAFNGSGKTVMACAEAARLAAEAPRDGRHHVLMLCFNHAMADELLRHPMLAEQCDALLVSTFHDFCIGHILGPRKLEHLVNYTGSGDRLPDETLKTIYSLAPEEHHYDAIFVDEAQDFRRSWWQIIHELLIPGGKFYIFADKNQDLYDRYDQLPELPTRVNLSRNLRNARQIAGFSRAMLPVHDRSGDILPMTGAGVFISPPADSVQERAAQVQRIIQELFWDNTGVQPRDIVVLSPWRTTHARCSLNLVPGLATAPADETPDQAAKRRNACRKPDATQIFASTVKSFKGQEAAYVIVTDIIGLGESRGFDMKELYTACTRARYGLYIVPTSTGKSLVESFTFAN